MMRFNCLYNCNNGLSKGVKLPATLLELRGEVAAVDCNGECWIDWMGILVEGNRWEEAGAWFD